MSKPAPLTAKDVKRGLAAAGFSPGRTTGGSHQKWIKYCVVNGKRTKYVVDVDEHHAPFSHDLTKSMANQAGISTKQFYELCSKDGVKQAKRGLLSWLLPQPIRKQNKKPLKVGVRGEASIMLAWAVPRIAAALILLNAQYLIYHVAGHRSD
jgi:hypothetical protein